MSRAVAVRDPQEFEQTIRSYLDRGYTLQDWGEEHADLREQRFGSPLGHVIVFFLVGWWTFLIGNAIYAAVSYTNADEVRIALPSRQGGSAVGVTGAWESGDEATTDERPPAATTPPKEASSASPPTTTAPDRRQADGRPPRDPRAETTPPQLPPREQAPQDPHKRPPGDHPPEQRHRSPAQRRPQRRGPGRRQSRDLRRGKRVPATETIQPETPPANTGREPTPNDYERHPPRRDQAVSRGESAAPSAPDRDEGQGEVHQSRSETNDVTHSNAKEQPTPADTDTGDAVEDAERRDDNETES